MFYYGTTMLMEVENDERDFFIETGTDLDVHGQDLNVAKRRAVEDAVCYNSMPGVKKILPDEDLSQMKVNVKLAVPADVDELDKDKIKVMIPYEKVSVEVGY